MYRIEYNPTFSKWPEFSIWPVSHAWLPDDDREYIMSAVNHYEWPVPVPRGVTLEALREELLQLGCRYAWVDVLCLRQTFPSDPQREIRRLQEWRTDVPLLGYVFTHYGKLTVTYFNGLGRRFEQAGWMDDRHWLNRVWTLQETQHPQHMIVGGVPNGCFPTKAVVRSYSYFKGMEKLTIDID